MSIKMMLAGALTAAVLMVATTAQAATITFGFTFTVADELGDGAGAHFHSNTGGSFGNPAGLAEVGELGLVFSNDVFVENIRGVSEYDLSGLAAAPMAFVTFDVFSLTGLFDGELGLVQDPYVGLLDVVAYAGNNTEDLDDFQAASIGTVGSFNTAGLGVGDIISLDITPIYNAAIGGGATSLGIRLQAPGSTAMQAITFNNFRLTTDDLTGSPVPEPATLTLLALGGAGAGVRRMIRRRRRT